MRSGEDFVVLQKTYDLVVELIPRIHRFPRSFKFTLGDRLENAVLDVLQDLVEARWRGDRTALLALANARLDRTRYLLRLAADFGLIKVRALGFLTGKLDEVGRLVGAWRKRGAVQG